ncbi:PQQ-dependent sugar dehydrogenase [Spongiivirga citrea]|uniref:Glucose sorbosone dehydrogenase n=1 Tax=Spongiivirga citrea TaxID=1481457 RepID=A0A6M0CIC3_9FLAO|nr:PQQ-dependent sugar dehydrogenase [Spongiivirga citrea]NER15694.1 glucose sorbosone dehydrogenase [Spongiivirga citrea]
MKILRFLLVITLFTAACASDDTPPVIDGDEMGEDGDNSDVNFELFNAFPELTFDQPVDLQSPNDGTNRIFVVEKTGRIQVFNNNVASFRKTTFLDLTSRISTTSEQGLLGLAFHPDFTTNGFFYVNYNPTATQTVIARFKVSDADADVADASSETVLMTIPQPFTNHNGGQVAFGPDGLLYIASGDGGSGGDPDNNGQDRSTWLGNILRIDVNNQAAGLNYAIPADNPFVGEERVKEEIYAYGLRNPWRMSFDTMTGELWTGDVGQGELEEIDKIISGGNYGWKLFEGTSCFSGNCDSSNLIAPVHVYGRSQGDRSITGGYVYRGATNTELLGKYVYGDFASGRIWAIGNDGTDNNLLIESGLPIASFGTDSAQELYVCAFSGTIYGIRKSASN